MFSKMINTYRNQFLLGITAVLFLGLVALSAFAADLGSYQDIKGEKLLIPFGKFLHMKTDGNVRKIMVAKEGIIEVLSVTDDNSVILTGKGDGKTPETTQLCIWYSDNRRIWHDVETYSAKNLLKEIIESRLGEKELVVEMLADSIYLKGFVTSPEKILEAQAVAEEEINKKKADGDPGIKIYNLLKVSGQIAGLEQMISEAIKIPTVKVTVINPNATILASDSQSAGATPVTTTAAKNTPTTGPAALRIILEGTVKDQNDYMHMVEVVKGFAGIVDKTSFDDKVSNLVVIENPLQVVFQAYVLQVNRRNVKDLGVDWGGAQSLSTGLTQGTLRFAENISNAFRGDVQQAGPHSTNSPTRSSSTTSIASTLLPLRSKPGKPAVKSKFWPIRSLPFMLMALWEKLASQGISEKKKLRKPIAPLRVIPAWPSSVSGKRFTSPQASTTRATRPTRQRKPR